MSSSGSALVQTTTMMAGGAAAPLPPSAQPVGTNPFVHHIASDLFERDGFPAEPRCVLSCGAVRLAIAFWVSLAGACGGAPASPSLTGGAAAPSIAGVSASSDGVGLEATTNFTFYSSEYRQPKR